MTILRLWSRSYRYISKWWRASSGCFFFKSIHHKNHYAIRFYKSNETLNARSAPQWSWHKHCLGTHAVLKFSHSKKAYQSQHKAIMIWCVYVWIQRRILFLYILCFLFSMPEVYIVQGVELKSGPILIWVIYVLRFTTCYITQLTCVYSKFWKWCPFISVHLSTRFTMFLATFLSVVSFFNHFRNSTFYWRLSSKFFKETFSTVGVRYSF